MTGERRKEKSKQKGRKKKVVLFYGCPEWPNSRKLHLSNLVAVRTDRIYKKNATILS